MPETMAPVNYWVNEAHKKKEAKELAARLKFDMPRGDMNGFTGLVYARKIPSQPDPLFELMNT
jgi:hypothetical protein